MGRGWLGQFPRGQSPRHLFPLHKWERVPRQMHAGGKEEARPGSGASGSPGSS